MSSNITLYSSIVFNKYNTFQNAVNSGDDDSDHAWDISLARKTSGIQCTAGSSGKQHTPGTMPKPLSVDGKHRNTASSTVLKDITSSQSLFKQKPRAGMGWKGEQAQKNSRDKMLELTEMEIKRKLEIIEIEHAMKMRVMSRKDEAYRLKCDVLKLKKQKLSSELQGCRCNPLPHNASPKKPLWQPFY